MIKNFLISFQNKVFYPNCCHYETSMMKQLALFQNGVFKLSSFST